MMSEIRRPLRLPTPEERKAALARQGLDDNLLPLTLTYEERKRLAPVLQAPSSEPVSPTGAPFVAPGSVAFRVLGVVMAVAAAVALKQPDLFPESELDQQIATVAMAIIGFVSPGLRHRK